jgi:phosphoadenosine phosphosulfate reductase
MAIWNDTLDLMKQKAEVSDSCLVAYSGGKDSLVVMDLCMKTFKNVVPFFMYFVPGLECVEKQLRYCKERWGKDVLMYPHWLLYRCMKNGIYCDEHFSKDEMPEPSLLDIYSWVRAETGISFLATGAKKSDSIWRRRCYFSSTAHWDWAFYPCQEWNKFDVMAYLEVNKIPMPDSSGKSATGIDLSTPSLLWLHDKYPDDFKTLLNWFPFAEAVVQRRKFYGIK